jgi:hypothetical protein
MFGARMLESWGLEVEIGAHAFEKNGHYLAGEDQDRLADLIGIGAAVTRRPLPHHRAYGSVHGGSSWLR